MRPLLLLSLPRPFRPLLLRISHVLSALNKLDAGDPEEILLSSRDGKDLLVVTFADVKRWIQSSR